MSKLPSDIINEFVTEFGDNLAELREMVKVLGYDCKNHLEAVQESDNQIHRRAYVRSVFAFIEGVMHRTKLTAAHLGGSMNKLTIEEIIAINEVTFDIDDKGEVINKSVFPRFLNNVKFTFKVFSKSFGSTFTLSLGGVGWQSLKEATKVRDRLMHPKQASDLEVTDAEIVASKRAFDWFFISHALCSNYSQKETQAKTSATPKDIATLDAHIAELETTLKNNGG